MSEVFVEFDTTIAGPDGTRWSPRVCGGIAPDGLWEGWIEFTPTVDTVEPVRTPRETEQPKRDDLMYWSQGLSHAYLEQALMRALAPRRSRPARPLRPASAPHFDAPARRPRVVARPAAPRPVLNPFEVHLQGEDVLSRQLAALDSAHVRDIAVAYAILTMDAATEQSRDQVTAAILSAARNPPVGRPRHGQGSVG